MTGLVVLLSLLESCCRLSGRLVSFCRRMLDPIEEAQIIRDWDVSVPLPLSRSKRPSTLILDLDETLVHTSHDAVPNADLVVEVVSRKETSVFYVLKRPHLDVFLQVVSKYFSVVIFTASVKRYADAVIDVIDINRVVSKRFFRESCFVAGNASARASNLLIKDVARASSDLSSTIILDNSPVAFSMHKENGIAISPWFSDPNDRELLRILPLLLALRAVDDVRVVLGRKYQLPLS